MKVCSVERNSHEGKKENFTLLPTYTKYQKTYGFISFYYQKEKINTHAILKEKSCPLDSVGL